MQEMRVIKMKYDINQAVLFGEIENIPTARYFLLKYCWPA